MFKPSVKNRMSLLILLHETVIAGDEDLMKWAFVLTEMAKSGHVEVMEYVFRTDGRIPYSQGLKNDIQFLESSNLIVRMLDGSFHLLEPAGRNLVERILETPESEFAHQWLKSTIREIVQTGGIADIFASMCREQGIQILSQIEWIRLMNRIERSQKRQEFSRKVLNLSLCMGALAACLTLMFFLVSKGVIQPNVSQPSVSLNEQSGNIGSQLPMNSGVSKDDGSTDTVVVTSSLIPFWFTPSN